MTQLSPTARSLAALGHDARLGIFRLLVQAGPDGLTVGEIAEHEGLAASTLAHHLGALVDAGLISTKEKRGREVVTRVEYDEMNRILAFLSSECCTGVVIAKKEDAA